MHFPVLQIWFHVFQYCIFTFQRPLITPLFGRIDRRTYIIEILTHAYSYDLYTVGQKKFDFYFSSIFHKMLRSAVNHLQCCLTLSLTPTYLQLLTSLSRRWRQRKRLYASMLSIYFVCLSVCLPVAKMRTTF